MAHPTVLPVLADLLLLEEPDRALTDTVNGAVWVYLAQMGALGASGIMPAPVTTRVAGHDSLAKNSVPVARRNIASSSTGWFSAAW